MELLVLFLLLLVTVNCEKPLIYSQRDIHSNSQSQSSSNSDSNNDNWEFTKHSVYSAADVHLCEQRCLSDSRCDRYTIFLSSGTSNTVNNVDGTHSFSDSNSNSNSNSNIDSNSNSDSDSDSNNSGNNIVYHCFLESKRMVSIAEKLPHIFNTSSVIRGHKVLFTNSFNEKVGLPAEAQYRRLLLGPVATDTTTVLNFQTHFLLGCKYTVSLWVYLWRAKDPLKPYAFRSIISTTPTYPQLSDQQLLFPTILYNVGNKPDQLFFAVSRDSKGDYLGIWSSSHVKYFEWMHLTMAIDSNNLVVYLNGEEAAFLSLSNTDQKLVCPYDNVGMNVVLPKQKKKGIYRTKSGIVSSNQTERVTNPWDRFVNNTVMRVAGARGRPSSLSMVHDVLIISNFMANVSVVHNLLMSSPPPKLPTLTKLLKSFDIYGLQNYTPIQYSGNCYLLKQWGVQFGANCNSICVSEKFLLDPTMDFDQKKTGNHQLSSTALVSITQSMNTVIVDEERVIPIRATSNKRISPHLPDIGHASEPVKNQPKKSKRADDGLTILNAVAHALLFDNVPVRTMLMHELGQSLMSYVGLKTSKKSNPLKTEKEQNAPARSSAVATKDKLPATAKARIQGLYKAAMIWMNGRHENINVEIATPLEEWLVNTEEKSFSALTLAMWMSDDEKSSADNDIDWVFRYPTMMGQPIHMALGNKAKSTAGIDVHTSKDLKFLQKSIEGEQLANLISGVEPKISNYIGIDSIESSDAEVDGSFQNGELNYQILHDGETLVFTSSASPDSRRGETEEDIALRCYREFANTTATDSLERVALLCVGKEWTDFFIAIEDSAVSDVVVPSHTEKHDYELALYIEDSTAVRSPHDFGTGECAAAASYYFPVTQYVTSHFGGDSKFGIGVLEEVRLHVSGGSAAGHHGEADTLHQHTEADAYTGDAIAQTWLGKKYYWGYGGLQRNELVARRWFEAAALQEEPEALYNLGCFYLHGRAGMNINPDLAHEYFKRAALADNPFPMALHAVGNYYLHNSQHMNLTLAREFFAKAALLNSSEGHFSYGAMLIDGTAGRKDFERGVFHMSIAASDKHVRAMNYLAHGLFDADSWLSQYGREKFLQRNRDQIQSAFQEPKSVNTVSQNSSDDKISEIKKSSARKKGKVVLPEKIEEIETAIKKKYRFDPSMPNVIHLPQETVVFPHPLGSSDGACEAALPLFKYLAEMGYRTKDVTKMALKEYLAGNYWAALELYEEAADLGVKSAQENAAFLYELLMEEECQKEDFFTVVYTREVDSKSIEHIGTINKELKLKDYCRYYFHRMATRRWIQLANAGEVLAKRKVADRILNDNEFRVLEKNATRAAILYGIAAAHGDVESMISLGWLTHEGADGVSKNSTMAKELFRKALNSEYKYQSSTQGLAPSIALLVIKADHLLEAFGCNTTMKEITNAAIDIQVAFKEFVRDYVGNVTSEIIIVKNFFLNHKEFLKQRDLLGNSGNIERDVWILLLLMVIFTLLLYGLFVRQYDS